MHTSIARRSLLAAFGCSLMAALPAAAQQPLNIGFVYQSPLSDVGWVAQHEAARKQLEKEFGSKVTTRHVVNVKVGQDGARVMRDMIESGSRLLVLGSFGYMNDGLRIASENPNIDFVHASGYKLAPNFGTYSARWYEGAYVAGTVAGRVTRTNTLGYVGAMPIPDVVATINAFALGVRSVNPAAKLRVVWVNEWFDPNKESEAVRSLVAQGADVVGSGFQDSPSVVKTADEAGVWSIGIFSDMTAYAPKKLLTSITHDWTPYLRQVTNDTLAGKFKGAPYMASLKDAGVGLAPWNRAVPADAVAHAKQVRDDIVSGKLKPFAGPLKDSEGKVRAAAGAVLPDGDIAGMNWFVEGIQGAVPR